MLSSVLNSKMAILVNIQIIRVFTKMRELLMTNQEVLLKLEKIEKKLINQEEKAVKHDEDIQLVFRYLKKLFNPANPPRKKIGFKTSNEE